MVRTRRKIEEIQSDLENKGWILIEPLTSVRSVIHCICPNGHKQVRSFINKPGCVWCVGRNPVEVGRVKEAFERSGWTLLQDSIPSSQVKLKAMCNLGHEILISWANFTQGTGCSKCSNKYRPTIKEVEDRFLEKGWKLLSETYKNVNSKLQYRCEKGHTSSISLTHLKRGYGCGNCRKDRSPNIDTVKKAFEDRGWVLTSIKYLNSHSKLDFECPQGHKGSMTWANFNRGAGCYDCNPGGFNYKKPGYLYYVRFEIDDLFYYKIGITNTTLKRRFNKESIPFKVLDIKYFEDGSECAKEEREILNKYSQFRWKGARLLHSGTYELFTKDVLELDKEQTILMASL